MGWYDRLWRLLDRIVEPVLRIGDKHEQGCLAVFYFTLIAMVFLAGFLLAAKLSNPH